MTTDNTKLYSVIDNFIKQSDREFTVDELISSFSKKTKYDRNTVKNYLDDNFFIFSNKENETGKFLPRRVFFKNAEFKISITKKELSEGILIPGHRFSPFCSPEIFPSECRISAHDEIVIDKKNYSCRLNELYDYHALLGSDGCLEYFIADNSTNSEKIFSKDPNQTIDLTVFDFKEILQMLSVKEGDSLIFKVKDWYDGNFELTGISQKESIEDENTIAWVEEMESALCKTFDKLGPYTEIPEQLSVAFYLSDEDLLKEPAVSIDSFLKLSENIHIRFFETHTILWLKQDTENASQKDELISISKGNIETLDSIFEDLGLVFTSSELEAFILDSICDSEESLDEIKKKCFLKTLKFRDDAQEAAFLNHTEELWENTQEKFNHINEPTPIINTRKTILNILEFFYTWLNLQYDPKSISDTELSDIFKNISHLKRVLELLISEHDELDEKDIEILDGTIKTYSGIIKELINKNS